MTRNFTEEEQAKINEINKSAESSQQYWDSQKTQFYDKLSGQHLIDNGLCIGDTVICGNRVGEIADAHCHVYDNEIEFEISIRLFDGPEGLEQEYRVVELSDRGKFGYYGWDLIYDSNEKIAKTKEEVAPKSEVNYLDCYDINPLRGLPFLTVPRGVVEYSTDKLDLNYGTLSDHFPKVADEES